METSTDTIAARPPRIPRAGRPRHLGVRIALVVFALVLVVLALAALSALGVRRHLENGRDEMDQGTKVLLHGDASAAKLAFDDAAAEFLLGADEARSPWLTVTGWVPIIGRTPDTVRAVADAGVQASLAASTLAKAIEVLPGGLGALAPSAEGIPIDHLTAMADAVASADRITGGALRTLENTPRGLVLGPVASARDEAQAELDTIHRQLHAGSLILEGLPSFLGGNGPRHYFFGASNPAELRGTGGLIGAYAILTIDHGRLSFTDFRPIESLPKLDVHDVPSPSPEYSENFDFYRTGVGFWLDINMTPDFPLAAKATWLAYRQATGEWLDGMIVADPFALQSLMRVTSPVPVAATGVEVTDRTIVDFVSNQAYALFDTNEQRKLVLGRVAATVLDSFVAQHGRELPRLRALLDAFDDGHVKVWTTDPSMEQGLALTTAGGAFRPAGTDAMSVVTNSASGTKLDFYQDRSVTYDLFLGPDGSASGTLRVELGNDSPTSGLPRYVIGPYKHYSTEPGENVAVVHLYCDDGCEVESATRNGRSVELGRYEQNGHPFFEDYIRTPSGETSTVTASLYLPSAWTGTGWGLG